MKEKKVDHLVVYPSKSVLCRAGVDPITYEEGKQSDEAVSRYLNIREKLEDGYLENKIIQCRRQGADLNNLSEYHIQLIDKVVNSITSEVGRAIVGLTIMQLTLKSIEPTQSIRLHKGSKNSSAFSWKEGVPMRVLDKNFITPTLRKYSLLKLNADGFMMTRSLAENYPYSALYKAAIKGARVEWIEITNLLEDGDLPAEEGLNYLISSLLNKSDEFQSIAEETISSLGKYRELNFDFNDVFDLIQEFIETSEYSARIFEVSIHSFFQALDELKNLSGYLKPLSQMRSANKKHGNIGDIEILSSENSPIILESWDAKYGKTYMRDELEEISDKLGLHTETEIAGFITNQKPDLKNEIINRINEIKEVYNVSIYIMSFSEWVDFQVDKSLINPSVIADKWIKCLTESLCQKRRNLAPIDEPTYEWVLTLNTLLKSKFSN